MQSLQGGHFHIFPLYLHKLTPKQIQGSKSQRNFKAQETPYLSLHIWKHFSICTWMITQETISDSHQPGDVSWGCLLSAFKGEDLCTCKLRIKFQQRVKSKVKHRRVQTLVKSQWITPCSNPGPTIFQLWKLGQGNWPSSVSKVFICQKEIKMLALRGFCGN